MQIVEKRDIIKSWIRSYNNGLQSENSPRKENLLVGILQYAWSRHQVHLLKPSKPQRETILQRGLGQFSAHRWIWQYCTRIDSICTYRNRCIPPRTAVPDLRTVPLILEAEKCCYSQYHPYHHSNRQSDNQAWWFPFHLLLHISKLYLST